MPSLEELRLALGVTSKSGVQRLLLQLEARGALTRAPRRTRAMQLTGAAVCPRCRAAIGEEARPAP
jgi:SOS-response transcriptional repressor LexA